MLTLMEKSQCPEVAMQHNPLQDSRKLLVQLDLYTCKQSMQLSAVKAARTAQ